MKIGIVILCRYQSQRLPGKILQEIRGRSLLGHILDRVRRGADERDIVVATSNQASDDPIAEFCRRSHIPCYRGPLEDVSERFLGCAKNFGWDYAVRINGDNLFADPDTLRAMLAIADTDVYDFVTNVPGRTFPYGMSVEILRVSFYKQMLAQFSKPSDREHVTLWLYEHPDAGHRYVFANTCCPEAAGLELALDTREDLARAEALLAQLGPVPSTCGLRDIVQCMPLADDLPYPWQGRLTRPLLIAEIGGNHEGDFGYAKALAQLAAETGVDAIKFQLYRGDTLVSPVESPDRNAHFKQFELSRDQHIELAELCRAKGIEYMASVWDLEMLEWIDPYLDRYKIGSGDFTAWPILRGFAERGKPMILATGLSTLDEVAQTVDFLSSVNPRYAHPRHLCLLQCTAMYPIPSAEAHVRAMLAFKGVARCAVGYSDHTEGGQALRLAAALGAEVLEFHFTDKREGREFRDHKVSLTPDEVRALKADLVQIATVLGNGVKCPQSSEIENGHLISFRRGIYLRCDVVVGETVAAEDLVCLRPNHGVDAREYNRVVGLTALQELKKYNKISLEKLQ